MNSLSPYLSPGIPAAHDYDADDRDYFQEWYDANVQPNNYLGQIKAGVMVGNVGDMLDDEMLRSSNRLGLFSAVANGDAKSVMTLLNLILTTAVAKADEYDLVLAQEAFETHCEHEARQVD